jgi:hypothetical protein
MADINVPKIGPVKKPAVIAIAVGAAGLIGYRYYSSRNSGADVTATDTSGTYDTTGTIPAVDGAVSADNSYGSGTTSNTVDSYGFTGTSNSEWTQYSVTMLQQSDTWSYTDIVTALGNYLSNKALSTTQQQIVQAALAVAGQPPEGSHTIVSGGDSTITVAPTGLSGTAISGTSIRLSWNPVAGAAGYRIYRSGVTQPVGEATSNTGEVGGLAPGTKYSFQVAAHTSAGAVGPKSGTFSASTTSVALKAPTTVTAHSITTTTLTLTWNAVPNANHYEIYQGASNVGKTAGTYFARGALHPGTKYTFQVVAVADGGAKSPKSKSIAVSTKRK